MKLTLNRSLLLLFIAKILGLFFAWYIIGSSTKLGDTQDYLAGYYLFRNDITSSAYLMSLLGSVFSSLFGYNALANLPVLLAAFLSLMICLKKINIEHSHKVLFVCFLCISPGYILWVSLHSKEALFNFFSFIFLVFLAKKVLDERVTKLDFILTFISLWALLYFKIAYTPAFIWLITFVYILPKIKQRLILAIALMISLISLGAYLSYIYIDELNLIFSTMHLHFSQYGSNTRLEHEWDGFLDMIYSLPVGIVISFFGPTLSELKGSIFNYILFLESVLSASIIVYLFMKIVFNNGKLNISLLLTIGGFVTLILVAHYPYGYFNFGSAVRYKQNFVPFLILMLLIFKEKVRR